MKKVIISFALLCLMLYSAVGQVPQQFSYQAAIRDNDGGVVANQMVSVRVSLLKSTADGEVVYQELHDVETNAQGIISLPVGAGTVETGVFSETPWSESIFIKVDVKIGDASDYSTMGVSQILSVPYAIQAGNAIQGDGALGNTVTHDGSMWAATNRISINENTVEIIAEEGHNPEEPIFAVRNSAGDIVFEVYEAGTRVYIDETAQKGTRGGFAVGGLSDQTKLNGVDFLSILPDEVQFNILQPVGKGRPGGFAVGGLSDQTKGLVTTHNFFTLLPDSARFTLVDNPEKGTRGGFAVGGLSDQTKGDEDYVYIDGDHTSILNTLNALGDVTIQGDMIYGGSISTAPIEDEDGNIYPTVKIGNQVWMKENLKKTAGLTEGTDYVAYDNDPLNVDNYGYLYTHTAIINENLCPAGWRVPVSSDWEELFIFVGGAFWTENTASVLSNLVEDSPLWNDLNSTPTNISGFSALPGGESLNDTGLGWDFIGEGDVASFWSLMNTDGNPEVVSLRGGEGLIEILVAELLYPIGYSVRCIKNPVID